MSADLSSPGTHRGTARLYFDRRLPALLLSQRGRSRNRTRVSNGVNLHTPIFGGILFMPTKIIETLSTQDISVLER